MPVDWDSTLLKASGAACVGWGALGIAAPAEYHKLVFSASDPANHPTARYFGMSCGAAGVLQINLADKSVKVETKKTALKTVGATWLVAAGLNVYHATNGQQKKDFGLVNAALQAGLGTAMIVQGTKKFS